MRMWVWSLAVFGRLKDPALPWAVVQVTDVAQIWHCRCHGSDSTPGLGTSICCRFSRKKKKEKRKRNIWLDIDWLVGFKRWETEAFLLPWGNESGPQLLHLHIAEMLIPLQTKCLSKVIQLAKASGLKSSSFNSLLTWAHKVSPFHNCFWFSVGPRQM